MKFLPRQPLHQIARFCVVMAAVTLACGAAPALAQSGSGNDPSAGNDPSGSPTETSVYTYNLLGNVSDCVGLYPKPECGTEPQLSGDRGGAMQYLTFGVIIVGLGIIMTVIGRNVIRTDRAKARQVEADLSKPSLPK